MVTEDSHESLVLCIDATCPLDVPSSFIMKGIKRVDLYNHGQSLDVVAEEDQIGSFLLNEPTKQNADCSEDGSKGFGIRTLDTDWTIGEEKPNVYTLRLGIELDTLFDRIIVSRVKKIRFTFDSTVYCWEVLNFIQPN